jgi:HlyD family secretion protein
MSERRVAFRRIAAGPRTTPSVLGSLAVAVALCACSPPTSNRIQGYIEGDFVYVASPRAGSLAKLDVPKGAEVKQGDALFALDDMPERASRDEAARKLDRARAMLEDAKKGKRPSEIESLTASLDSARAALDLSEKEAARQQKLHGTTGATTEHDVERALSLRDQDRQRVSAISADLETARAGSRVDQIAAAEADVKSAQQELARAEWDLAEKEQHSPRAGLVFDTLYREGDWVGAGLPVVMLLPPGNVKLRAFVAEERVGRLHLGDSVSVFVDGVAGSFTGKIDYISPRAEYTPPVVYSRDNRRKFVFMVEAAFEPGVATKLHPGQPVDVELAADGHVAR